jgi:adenylylsulfate kinase-like enzyme
MISRLLLQLQDTGSFRQVFRNDRQCGFSRFAGTLQQHLCKSVECLYLIGTGIITIAAFISPSNDIREMAANIIGKRFMDPSR